MHGGGNEGIKVHHHNFIESSIVATKLQSLCVKGETKAGLAPFLN